MWLLVSFCNSIRGSSDCSRYGLSQLAVIDVRCQRLFFVKIPREIDFRGFTGLACSGEHIYTVTYTRDVPYLVRLKKRGLGVDLVRRAETVKDPHSMVCFGGRLYLVSSGTNSVEMFDLNNFDYLGKYYQHPGTTPTDDQVHLNSIFLYKGQLWGSAFGLAVDKNWSKASNGYLVNMVSGQKLYKIYHPHSVVVEGDDFYFCESWTSSVCKNGKVLKRVSEAYVRGLAVDKERLVVGVSSGRRVSKSRGIVNAVENVGRHSTFSGVLVMNRRNQIEGYWDLSKYFREIYDIRVVNDIVVDTKNIVGEYEIKPSKTVYKNFVASLLMDENEELRRRLDEVEREKVIMRNELEMGAGGVVRLDQRRERGLRLFWSKIREWRLLV